MGLYDETLVNTYLYGLVSYQFALYYQANFNDRWPVKCMVLFLFFLDTVHSAAYVFLSPFFRVTNYANPAALEYAAWPYPFTPIGTALAAFVTHMFLGDRIYRLTHNKVLFGIIIAMALPTFALGIACGVKAWIILVIADMPRINNLATAWLTMQVVVDIFITSTLSIILARAKTGWSVTDTVLRRLIRGAVQTGLFASIFSLGDLISFLALPTTNFYGMFAIPIGRIYSNVSRFSSPIDSKVLAIFPTNELDRPYWIRFWCVMGWVPGETTAPGPAATSIHLGVHRSLHD
ncbi:hypothetical protein EDD15DRAFT_2281957 [Pisolithus albus]|nr:hypothetical protein EDD15DRAFT_2281957 [Pisolithus albus]